jgi:glycosyltransferase involved in cell wall biosynthesis
VTSQQKKIRRLAVVLSHPTQYYSPWFRWIQVHTELEFRVFYLWDFGVTRQLDPQFGTTFKWDVDLISGYENEFVPNTAKKPGAEYFFGFNNPGITDRLRQWRPDAILLFGYKWASHLRVVIWGALNGVPIVFRGDSHLLGRETPALGTLLALRTLFSRFAAFLYVGSANREYFERFGVPGRRLVFGPHSVNADLYDRHDPATRAKAVELRSKLGIPTTTQVVLFAGKLLPQKQPVELLREFIRLQPVDAALVIVGNGPELEKLQSIVANESATNIYLMPFANQSEMPARYMMADIFALPSKGVYETWGLAVNEAMLMGIPCIVSTRVGCQRDLVTQGETGWVFNADDPGGLGRALSEALSDICNPARKAAIKTAVDSRIAGYTYVQTTNGLLTALELAGDPR